MSLDFNFSLEELAAAEVATENSYLTDPAKGLQLISSLIARSNSNTPHDQRRHLHRLHQLIHQSFVSLAARNDYPAEAQAYRELIALEQSLEDLVAFPDLANKTVIGIGGGFSAGKSRFLNILLGVEVLPESLEPTTAIPSYVISGESQKIVALNSFFQKIELDQQALLAITHAFHKKYQQLHSVDVGFAHIIRLLMVRLPGMWSRLAFLDTPGYSKSDRSDSIVSDSAIATSHLSEADHILWLISAKNGSIRRDDLEFLRTLNHKKPVFFVVTQSDLVSKQRIRAILESTKKAICDAGIAIAGLMAWEAPIGAIKGHYVTGDNVYVWFDSLNKNPKRTRKRLVCARIFDSIIDYNINNLTNNRELLAVMNEMMPIASNLSSNRIDTIRLQIERLRKDQRRLNELIVSLSELKQEMLDTITEIVGPLAEDEDVKGGHELIFNVRRAWMKRTLSHNEVFEIRVLAIKTDVKKIIVEFGDGIATTGIGFRLIRGALRIDPQVLVKGSLLQGEVRSVDDDHITIAIRNPHALL